MLSDEHRLTVFERHGRFSFTDYVVLLFFSLFFVVCPFHVIPSHSLRFALASNCSLDHGILLSTESKLVIVISPPTSNPLQILPQT